MKRIFSIILAVVLTLSAVSVNVFADAVTFTKDSAEYASPLYGVKSDSGATLINYTDRTSGGYIMTKASGEGTRTIGIKVDPASAATDKIVVNNTSFMFYLFGNTGNNYNTEAFGTANADKFVKLAMTVEVNPDIIKKYQIRTVDGSPYVEIAINNANKVSDIEIYYDLETKAIKVHYNGAEQTLNSSYPSKTALDKMSLYNPVIMHNHLYNASTCNATACSADANAHVSTVIGSTSVDMYKISNVTVEKYTASAASATIDDFIASFAPSTEPEPDEPVIPDTPTVEPVDPNAVAADLTSYYDISVNPGGTSTATSAKPTIKTSGDDYIINSNAATGRFGWHTVATLKNGVELPAEYRYFEISADLDELATSGGTNHGNLGLNICGLVDGAETGNQNMAPRAFEYLPEAWNTASNFDHEFRYIVDTVTDTSYAFINDLLVQKFEGTINYTSGRFGYGLNAYYYSTTAGTDVYAIKNIAVKAYKAEATNNEFGVYNVYKENGQYKFSLRYICDGSNSRGQYNSGNYYIAGYDNNDMLVKCVYTGNVNADIEAASVKKVYMLDPTTLKPIGLTTTGIYNVN